MSVHLFFKEILAHKNCSYSLKGRSIKLTDNKPVFKVSGKLFFPGKFLEIVLELDYR